MIRCRHVWNLTTKKNRELGGYNRSERQGALLAAILPPFNACTNCYFSLTVRPVHQCNKHAIHVSYFALFTAYNLLY